MGKKASGREGGQAQPRKEFLDSSLFYYEYLNNALNYILSGSNDLDHSLQFDAPALRQIVSTEPTEESVHFIERVKLMKTACDPAAYLKDVQEYGEFINYEVSRSYNQEIAAIEAELRDEFEIAIKLKRIKKWARRTDDKLTLCQIEIMDRQMREQILAGFLEPQPMDVEEHMDENRLYREMFNIQEAVKREERTEVKREREREKEKEKEKEKPRKGPKRTRTAEEYMPASLRYKDGANAPAVPLEDPVKKEEYIERNPIRQYPSGPSPLTQPPTKLAPQAERIPQPPVLPPISNRTPLPVHSAIPPHPAVSNPLVALPQAAHHAQLVSSTPPQSRPVGRPPLHSHHHPHYHHPPLHLPASIHTPKVEKMQEEVKTKPVEPIVEKPSIKEEVNPINPASSNMTSSAEPLKTDPEKKHRRHRKIEKEDKQEKVRKPRGPKKGEKEKADGKKRPYKRRQLPAKPEEVKFPHQLAYIPTQVLEKKCVEIGIQADVTENYENLKVIAPRSASAPSAGNPNSSSAVFTLEKITPAVPPLPAAELKRELTVERKESESISLHRSSNLLNSSREYEASGRREPPSPNRMEDENRNTPAAFDSQRRSEPQERDGDFDISDYLI